MAEAVSGCTVECWTPARDGLPVVMSPHLEDGSVLMITGKILIGTYPKTEIQLAREEARWLVRSGLSDVLEWLGEKVGPRHSLTGAEVLESLKEATRL